MKGDKFIKIKLSGMGWGEHSINQRQDYGALANYLQKYLNEYPYLKDKEYRTITISICEEIDDIHSIEFRNTQLVINAVEGKHV